MIIPETFLIVPDVKPGKGGGGEYSFYSQEFFSATTWILDTEKYKNKD